MEKPLLVSKPGLARPGQEPALRMDLRRTKWNGRNGMESFDEPHLRRQTSRRLGEVKFIQKEEGHLPLLGDKSSTFHSGGRMSTGGGAKC